ACRSQYEYLQLNRVMNGKRIDEDQFQSKCWPTILYQEAQLALNKELYVVIVTFNLNKARQQSLLEALRKLKKQKGPWKLILVELLVGTDSILDLSEFNNLHEHKIIKGSELNLDIWQKEALQNLAV